MKKLFFATAILSISVSFGQSIFIPGGFTSTGIGTSTVQGNIGVGTTNPRANLDMAKDISNGQLGTVFGRLPEGNETGLGTYLGVKGYTTQGNDLYNLKSFSIVHDFYGQTNSSINFLRGGSILGGCITFSTFDNTEKMRIAGNGNVGIGTINPTSKLDVRGTISTPEIAFRNADGGDDSDPYRLRKVQGSSNVNWLELQLNDDFNESFRIYGNSCVGFGCGEYSGNLYHSFDAGGNVFHSGNVGIGTTNPTSKLTVAGNINSREVKVSVDAGADFVFDKDYILPSLQEVEKFVTENKHLPEIASAKEMQKEGINLSEMNIKLLQKIEELTLYLIELKNENQIIKKNQLNLEKRIENFEIK